LVEGLHTFPSCSIPVPSLVLRRIVCEAFFLINCRRALVPYCEFTRRLLPSREWRHMKTGGQLGVQSQPEWFASWFDSEHYHKLYAHRGEREAADFISRLIAWLQPNSGSSILDLGCGSGRHSRCLASMGFDVTGLDLSIESIKRAKQSERSNLRFHRQELRQTFGTYTFAYIFKF